MNEYNLTNPLNEISLVPGPVHFSEVLQDLCTQIDSKLLLGGFFILTYFVFRMFIFPQAYKGFKSLFESVDPTGDTMKTLTRAYEQILSLLETFGLGSAIFIIAIFYYQNGLPLWAWIVTGVYSSFFITFIISWLIGYIRRKLNK